MIAKMKSNISIGATLGYNLKDESQIIETHNLVGEHVQDYELQMRSTQNLFEGRARNLTAHIIISPSIDDGAKLTLDDWKSIANDFRHKADLEKYEAIVFLHDDREHRHLHMVVNRVDELGQIYRNGNELNMSQRIGNEIALERGLKQAREVNKERGLETEAPGTLSQISKDIKQAAAVSRDKVNKLDQKKFFEELRKTGYTVKEFFNKETGSVRGYGVEKDGIFYNASQIGKDVTLSALNRKEVKNESKQVISLEDLRKDLRAAALSATKNKQFDQERYFENLKKAGYGITTYFQKGTNKMRGYGIEKNGTYYNSSSLGKEYTLKNIKNMEREQKLQEQREYFQRAREIREQKELDTLKKDLEKETERLKRDGKETSTLKEMMERNLEFRMERMAKRESPENSEVKNKEQEKESLEKAEEKSEGLKQWTKDHQQTKEEKEREQLRKDLEKETERLKLDGKETSTLKEMMERNLELMDKRATRRIEQNETKQQGEKITKGKDNEQGISH